MEKNTRRSMTLLYVLEDFIKERKLLLFASYSQQLLVNI